MHGKSTKILLAAVLVFGAATSGLAQGTGTRPGTSPHPWTSLGGSNPGFAGQTGVPTRPLTTILPSAHPPGPLSEAHPETRLAPMAILPLARVPTV
jgi:hypothetical protein